MKVVVHGLWHLGSVTAACIAEAGHDVVGLDDDPATVRALEGGRPPVLEPGLAELIAVGVGAGRLRFTTDAAQALEKAHVLWVTLEAPLDDQDRADVAFVRRRLQAIGGAVRPGTLVLVSSQVPAGFTRDLEAAWTGRGLSFAYAPENLRLGQALEAFRRPERVVVGIRNESERTRIAALFGSLGVPVEWMSIESAEATKHAVNAYLATSVAFANELARVCEAVGADPREVERGLRSEPRIGARAYVSPGGAPSGGTLAREVRFLDELARAHGVEAPLLASVLRSNAAHTRWLLHKIAVVLAGIAGPRAAVLGLASKAGTDTLRRSASLELCHWLLEQGVEVRAHDPVVRELPADLRGRVLLRASPEEAWRQADVLIVATPWPQYLEIRPDDVVAGMRCSNVFDPGAFLAASLGADARVAYRAPGRPESARAGAFASVTARDVGEPTLDGRVAIVTGGSEGLGRATAALFLQRGADVLVSARRADRLREAA
ncbi:MAG TPA: nucleotide sugar dehydrogenase, partial [Vicinamibacteria bacterium]|nr:nucleotide sugar dehydrogenase [Vicinamibacteria bacterium]